MPDEYMVDDTTWKSLRDFLNTLKEDDLKLAQQVQVLPHQADLTKPVHLLPVSTWGTVGNLCHVDGQVEIETRAADRFEHRPDQLVLSADASPFGERGDSWYTQQPDGSLVGNVSGEVVPGLLTELADWHGVSWLLDRGFTTDPTSKRYGLQLDRLTVYPPCGKLGWWASMRPHADSPQDEAVGIPFDGTPEALDDLIRVLEIKEKR